jgi:hypothetical protein
MNIYNDDSEYNYQMQIAQDENEEANVALIRQGCLGASPSQPTIAFTLEALEFYHQLRRHQANFSVQAFIKVLCAIHNVCQAINSIRAYWPLSRLHTRIHCVLNLQMRLTLTLLSSDMSRCLLILP